MTAKHSKKQVDSALTLLKKESTTIEKAESVTSLLKGINPQLDNHLDRLSKILSDIKNLQEGDLIELGAQNLPTQTEKDKRRKKAILLFIKTWRELKGEVERVQKELNSNQNSNLQSTRNIASKAKGPFGLITIAAIIIVGTIMIVGKDNTNSTSQNQSHAEVQKNSIQAIKYQDKIIPIDQLVSKKGPDCGQEDHYHAKNGPTVETTDDTLIQDPGACAFGKLSEADYVEINP